MTKLALTEEDFDSWRNGGIGQYIFDVILPKHMEETKQAYLDKAWSGDLSEATRIAHHERVNVLEQLRTMTFADLESWAGGE